MRGAGKTFNEDTKSSGAFGQGQTVSRTRLCPCGVKKDGLLRFLSGGRGSPGMSLENQDFLSARWIAEAQKIPLSA